MNRREALQLLATGTALHLAPPRVMAVLRQARILLDIQAAPRTLNAHQSAMVKAMAELILPRTDTPGAADVGASDFIDLMLTEWYDEQDRARFLKGLAETDRHTTGLFGRAFIETSPDQQAEILSWLGEKMTAELDAQRSLPHQSRRSRQVVSEIFYFMLRHLTLTAYYTSEAGASAELHFQVIPDSHEGCAAVPIDKEGT